MKMMTMIDLTRCGQVYSCGVDGERSDPSTRCKFSW